MNEKTLKMVGTGLTILGMGVQLAVGFIDGKKFDLKIAKEVSKQLNKK